MVGSSRLESKPYPFQNNDKGDLICWKHQYHLGITFIASKWLSNDPHTQQSLFRLHPPWRLLNTLKLLSNASSMRSFGVYNNNISPILQFNDYLHQHSIDGKLSISMPDLSDETIWQS